MRKIFYSLLFILLFFIIEPVFAAEPMMKLVPSSGTYTKDSTFDVLVAVDSGTIETMAVDVFLKYDPTEVEIESAIPVPNLLETIGLVSIGPNDDKNGTFSDRYYISSDRHTSERAVVSGNLINIKFKPKIEGTVNIDFICTPGSDSESNIFDGTTTTDMINCPSNINGVYTINNGGTSSNPNPTTVPTAVPTSGTELPKTGTVETTIGLIIFGVVSVLSSLALKFL